MPIISALTSQSPNSTSDLIVNVGSTTHRTNLSQVVGGIFTSQGQLIYSPSSRASTFLNPPTSGAVLSYSSGSSAPAWTNVTSGGVLIGSAANVPSFLAAPSSGAVMTFSSVSSIPAWSIPTSGAVLVASSLGVPTWRAIGTSGQILESTGGTPTWTNPAGTTIGWEVSKGTSQAITSNLWTAITLLAENFDSDGFHSTSVGSTLVTIKEPGTYIFGLYIQVDDDSSVTAYTTGEAILARILENDSSNIYQINYYQMTAITGPTFSGSVLRRFATSGATLTPQVFVTTAAQLDADTSSRATRFWGYRVGP